MYESIRIVATVDLEIFMLINKLSYDKILCTKIFVGMTPYHINVRTAHMH